MTVIERLSLLSRQHQDLDPEAGVEPVQVLGQKAAQMVGLARRPACAQADGIAAAVDPVGRQAQPAQPLPRFAQAAAKRQDQALRAARHILAPRTPARNRLGEHQPLLERRLRALGRERFGQKTQRLIQTLLQRPAETRLQPGGRQAVERLDPA